MILLFFLFACISGFALDEGNRPSYVDISTCSKPALEVIEKHKFPKKKIHHCVSQKVPGYPGHFLVTVHYGEAQDCLSGCFYDFFNGVWNGKRGYKVAIDHQVKSSFLWAIQAQGAPHKMKNCKLLGPQKPISKLLKRNGQWGWHFTLRSQYRCSYEDLFNYKMDKTKMKYYSEGAEFERTWSGSLFGVLKGESYTSYDWDNSQLRYKDKKLKEFRRYF